MAYAGAPPKSILKKTTSLPPPESANLPVPKTDQERRSLATAIQHAHLIQEQRDVQSQILDAIEELSDYPAGATPTATEMERYRSLVTSFQPSDFDALVEERHANGRCGNTLCPHAPRKADPKRGWLYPKGADNWCSDECAKRALYVKAQLDEVPAWERRGGSSPAIVLRRDATRAANDESMPKPPSKQEELAYERGEKVASFKIDGVMSQSIVEKRASAVTAAPTVRFHHEEIEGYLPRGVVEERDAEVADEP